MGFLGDVTLTWQAEPREASVLDFWPSSGTISLKDKEAHTDIVVYILDDTINEPMEVYRLTGTHFFSCISLSLSGKDNTYILFINQNISYVESCNISDFFFFLVMNM